MDGLGLMTNLTPRKSVIFLSVWIPYSESFPTRTFETSGGHNAQRRNSNPYKTVITVNKFRKMGGRSAMETKWKQSFKKNEFEFFLPPLSCLEFPSAQTFKPKCSFQNSTIGLGFGKRKHFERFWQLLIFFLLGDNFSLIMQLACCIGNDPLPLNTKIKLRNST